MLSDLASFSLHFINLSLLLLLSLQCLAVYGRITYFQDTERVGGVTICASIELELETQSPPAPAPNAKVLSFSFFQHELFRRQMVLLFFFFSSSQMLLVDPGGD